MKKQTSLGSNDSAFVFCHKGSISPTIKPTFEIEFLKLFLADDILKKEQNNNTWCLTLAYIMHALMGVLIEKEIV